MRFLQFVIFLLSITLTALNVSALPHKQSSARKEVSPKLVKASASDVAQVTTLIFLPQEQEIELALSAAPEHLRLNATVYVFKKRGYEKIHNG